MDEETFIYAVKEHIFESAADQVISSLSSPAGRSPSKELLAMSEWYNKQDEESKQFIAKVVREGAHTSMFGIFCVLDGVRLIHEDLRDGVLRLVLETETQTTILSDNQSVSELHDLFNAVSEGIS